MEKSPSIQNLTQGLAKFHTLVGRISKDAANPFFKKNYASLPHIITEISEPMEKAGLVISQFPDGDGLTTMLIHADSGEYLSATYTLQVVRQNDPQAQGSALSYARRYSLMAACGIAPADDDGNAASKPAPVAAPKPVPKPVEVAPPAPPKKVEGVEGPWQLKVSTSPGTDVDDWSVVVAEATVLALEMAQSADDVTSIFKINRVVFDNLKALDPTTYDMLLSKFKEFKEKLNAEVSE